MVEKNENQTVLPGLIAAGDGAAGAVWNASAPAGSRSERASRLVLNAVSIVLLRELLELRRQHESDRNGNILRFAK